MSWGGLKILPKGEFYTPDTITLTKQRKVTRTRSGHATTGVTGNDAFELEDISFPAYLYIAGSRSFSNEVIPEEYGLGETSDSLIALIYTRDLGDYASRLRPGEIIAVTREDYTGENALYRVVTGNPYADIGVGHVEVRIVPKTD